MNITSKNHSRKKEPHVEEAEQEVDPEDAPVSGNAVASFISITSKPVISKSFNSIFSPPFKVR